MCFFLSFIHRSSHEFPLFFSLSLFLFSAQISLCCCRCALPAARESAISWSLKVRKLRDDKLIWMRVERVRRSDECELISGAKRNTRPASSSAIISWSFFFRCWHALRARNNCRSRALSWNWIKSSRAWLCDLWSVGWSLPSIYRRCRTPHCMLLLNHRMESCWKFFSLLINWVCASRRSHGCARYWNKRLFSIIKKKHVSFFFFDSRAAQVECETLWKIIITRSKASQIYLLFFFLLNNFVVGSFFIMPSRRLHSWSRVFELASLMKSLAWIWYKLNNIHYNTWSHGRGCCAACTIEMISSERKQTLYQIHKFFTIISVIS